MDLGVLATYKESKEGTNRGLLRYGCEGFVIVFPPSLGEAFSTEAGFVKATVLDT